MSAAVGTTRGASVARAVRRSLITAVVSIVAITVLWVVVLWALRVPSFVGQGPLDVLNYLVAVPAAADNRAYLVEQLGITLADSAIGFVVGLAGALILAALFMLFRPVEHALLPIALLLQSVPLIAVAPIIILIFGRDGATVAVMGGLVVLFPALVIIAFGLRSASPFMVEIIEVYGGSPLTVLRKVSLPSAGPAFFAAVRISVPGAITGALIAEWLATGQGVGRAIVSAIGQAKMNEVWAMTVAITALSILLYMLVGLIESAVVAKLGMSRAES